MVKQLPAIALAVLIFGSALPAAGQFLRVYYPDVEQGSATLVVSPTGKALLVDAGSGIKAAEDRVEDFVNDLIDAGVVTSLDFTLASHYDEDHIGRLENVLQLVPLAPGAIAYDRGEFGGTPATFAYSDYAFSASFHNRTTIPVCTVLDLGGGVTATVIAVNGEVCGASPVDILASSSFENSASISVVVNYGDVDLWIGGDLTGNPNFGITDVESTVATVVGDLDVYTVNHHGSTSSSNQALLDAMRAEVAINQSAANNGFGHPRSEVVSRILLTEDSSGGMPFFIQQNPGDPDDDRSDDAFTSAIADCDDRGSILFADGFESGDTSAWGLTPPLLQNACNMPGTLALLADGNSYRLHACGLAATTFAADAGPGTFGDYPPAIRRVWRVPQVPLASQGVTVAAQIDDAVSAEIEFSLDGVPQTPIAMVFAGGFFTGTIPAQTDGSRVAFRVSASDGSAQTEVSQAQGYFSGLTPISTLRQNDGDGVLEPKHHGVRIQGVVTAEPGVFHPDVTLAYVQDATGGVQIFDAELLPLGRGESAQFVGRLEQFAGQTEINIAEDCSNLGHTSLGPGTLPTPQVLTVAQVDEAVEGRLIRINNVSVVEGTIPETDGGNLTVSDDGGLSTLELRIDGDTDIPGANTPTQTFDVIGIASQFDSFVPLTSGFQIVPRERADFLTVEVNHPVVLIAEIHANPAPGLAGDANGDGVSDTDDDEFIEIVNTGFNAIDISGYSLSDALQIRHTFAPGTILPPREAAVVFGGGSPTGAFGNAAANGLVFTATTGGLLLDNFGDTVTLRDDLDVVVQAVPYGAVGAETQSLVRDPDFSNAPLTRHTQATGSGGSRYSPGARISGQAFTITPGSLLITEVMVNPSGADNGLEWIELYNAAAVSLDLNDVCIGNGGTDYTSSLVSLTGTSLAAGSTLVVGGPDSTLDNGEPILDLPVDFTPDFQNGGATADGVALFSVRCSQVTASTVPIDAVVYGDTNTNGLIDESGSANPPEVTAAGSGQSLERVDLAGNWQIQCQPDPNAFVPGGPPPAPAGLLLSEVLYNPSGSDAGLEWVELFNNSAMAIDLAQFSLGNGGTTYTSSQVQLVGVVAAGATFVVGGPTSSAVNGNPAYDQTFDFTPDFQNSGSAGDGVALFAQPACQVSAATVPIDAVVYGPNNNNGLIDETGVANPPEVANASRGSSIERTDLAGSWQIQAAPTPNSSPLE